MNPWLALPSRAPYVLPEDRSAVERFNRTAAAPVRLETSLLPEPYVGRVDAPVVLLTLNPGVSPGDFALHTDSAFQQRVPPNVALHLTGRPRTVPSSGKIAVRLRSSRLHGARR